MRLKIYDSWIKGDTRGKIRPVLFLILCIPTKKNVQEMIIIPKDNILMYFKVRQKFIMLCTH